MSIPAHGAQRRRLPIPGRARLLAAGIVLVGLLATGLALAGVLPARQVPGAARTTQPTKVDFGLPSHAGLVRVGAAPGSFPVTLELGLLADQKGIATAARASSDPSSSTYGIYPTLSAFARHWGADPARRHAVIDALSAVGIRGAVDATGMRVTAPTTIGRIEKLFARQWSLYATRSAGTFVALPDGRPRIPKGLRGNVDVVAGASPFLVRRPRLTQRGRVEVTSRPSRCRCRRTRRREPCHPS